MRQQQTKTSRVDDRRPGADGHRQPLPSGVIWDTPGSPVLVYERITAAQVEALGLLALDERESWAPGVYVLRAGDRFNVRAASLVIAQRDAGFERFLGRLMHSTAEGAR